MILEISVLIIALCLISLVTALIVFLVKIKKITERASASILNIKTKVEETMLPQSSEDEVTTPQLIGWLISSVILIKKTREFIKNI